MLTRNSLCFNKHIAALERMSNFTENTIGTNNLLDRFRMSTSSCRWQSIQDKDIRGAYEHIYKKLHESMCNQKTIDRSMSLLCAFVWQYQSICNERDVSIAPDVRILNGTRDGMIIAQNAWMAMKVRGQWTQEYTRKAQTLLSQTLAVVVEPLAVVVNPLRRTQGTF